MPDYLKTDHIQSYSARTGVGLRILCSRIFFLYLAMLWNKYQPFQSTYD